MNSNHKKFLNDAACTTAQLSGTAFWVVLFAVCLTVSPAVGCQPASQQETAESTQEETEQEPADSDGAQEEATEETETQETETQENEQGTDENPIPDTREESAEPVEEFEEWGHLTGKIILSGDIPEIAEEAVDKDQATCITDGNVPKDDNLIVGENGELKDVFVTLYKADSPEIHPSYATLKETPVVLDNQNCRFVPHAAVVLTGQELILKNSDDVGHNCHGVGFNNEFNVNLATGSSTTMLLEQAESSPMNITCDIHSWMDSVLMVRDDPYVAISAEDGTFTIANLPEGTWEIQFWHKRTANMKKLVVEGYEVGRKGQIEVTITKGTTIDLGEMTFDAADLKDR